MNPQEKAKELVDKFKSIQVSYSDSFSGTMEESEMDYIVAKKCALIAVDEIINSEPSEPYDGGYYELISDRQDEVSKYWQNVKEAITNL